MKYSLFIGIDISKKKLDLSIFDGRKILNSFEIKNETSEIKEFFLSTLKELNIESKEVLLCAEHTSITRI